MLASSVDLFLGFFHMHAIKLLLMLRLVPHPSIHTLLIDDCCWRIPDRASTVHACLQ